MNSRPRQRGTHIPHICPLHTRPNIPREPRLAKNPRLARGRMRAIHARARIDHLVRYTADPCDAGPDVG